MTSRIAVELWRTTGWDRPIEIERRFTEIERRLDALEGQPAVAIEPRYHEPPRLSAEIYTPEFWERMEARS